MLQIGGFEEAEWVLFAHASAAAPHAKFVVEFIGNIVFRIDPIGKLAAKCAVQHNERWQGPIPLFSLTATAGAEIDFRW